MDSQIPCDTLYDRIGGRAGIEQLIGRFYDRVLADPELTGFFTGRDIEKLRHMQHEFFSAALGGPVEYTGRPVIHAHQGMGITTEHFRRFAEHLFDTLGHFGLDEQDRYEVVTRINAYVDDVVSASGDMSG